MRRSARLTYTRLCIRSRISVVTRLASVSILSDEVSPYPAGYGFPLPFGCWPSLLKQSLPPTDMCRRCRWPTGLRQTVWGLSRSASSSYDRRRRPLYRGEALVFQNRFVRTGSLPAFCSVAGSPHVVHRSEMLSHAFTFRWMDLTRPGALWAKDSHAFALSVFP